MVKIDNKNTIIMVLVIVVSLIAFKSLTTTNEIMINAKVTDSSNQVTGQDNLAYNQKTLTSQSILGFGSEDHPYSLMSTLPVQDKSNIFLTVNVVNTYTVPVKLTYVNLYYNDNLLDTIKFADVTLEPGKSYSYVKDFMRLSGQDTERQILKLQFYMQKPDGKVETKTYTYQYTILTTCSTKKPCPGILQVCDNSNKAGFGTGYCVKLCNGNEDCYKGQICKVSVCGY